MTRPNWDQTTRLTGLRRFAIAITVFNILGHLVFGFEQSYAQPIFALAVGYSMEILLEIIDSKSNNRQPAFTGGFIKLVNFLLPAHISSLAISMLIYANDQFLPLAFAISVMVGSKYIIRMKIGNANRHIFNPSNLGIATTLIVFPWVGISPPYHFTENLNGVGDWILPALILISGSHLNATLTKRVPLIASWVGGFALQAIIRNSLFGTPLVAGLLPMTGVAFILYTFYMITDPATSPSDTRRQIYFGLTNALVYALLMKAHIVFGLFFALTITCGLRGLLIYIHALGSSRAEVKTIQAIPAEAMRRTEA